MASAAPANLVRFVPYYLLATAALGGKPLASLGTPEIERRGVEFKGWGGASKIGRVNSSTLLKSYRRGWASVNRSQRVQEIATN